MWLVAVPVAAQMTYEERAALAADSIWQQRVGIAAQQQAIVVNGEPPETCCQTSTQEVLASTSGKQTVRTLCDVILPPGDPKPPGYLRNASIDRHAARQQLATQVLEHAATWAGKMAAIIASDSCVTGPDFADAALQAYMLRLWDIYALSPDLAATPVGKQLEQEHTGGNPVMPPKPGEIRR
jgi:hypothetical protein